MDADEEMDLALLAGASLEFAYQNLAEPLADASCDIEDADDVTLPDDVDDTAALVLTEIGRLGMEI